MRDYEVVYIFQSTLAPEDIEGKLESYHAILTTGDSQVTAVEHWGRRQLAYPIRKETSGYYVVAQFTASPELLLNLERALKLDEHLLRYLIVLSEGELPLAPSKRFEGNGSAREGDKAAADRPEDAEAQPKVGEPQAEDAEAQPEDAEAQPEDAEAQPEDAEAQPEDAAAGLGEEKEEKEED